jgi:hypothetical protein
LRSTATEDDTVSAQRIQKADVIAIRHLDTVGLLLLRSSAVAQAKAEIAPPRYEPYPRRESPTITPESPRARASGSGRVWTLTLGLLFGVVCGLILVFSSR